ncbi:solute carrier organic anion transporter family member 5A1-like isoform X2 [Amphiura filiformis]|uniref:solute carrier organic anion transporter family member 5A1-like isoform X2 n=1 Tax=Amphiura filiformis TaxID=82378 RepID=UPI003B217281
MSQQTDEVKSNAKSFSHRTFSFLHKLVGPKLFTIHATLIIALRTACYGYFSGIVTTLERRFQLSSSEAGTLIIINDISELCFIVIASHFGHKSHRPRWISLGSITMGIGMLICAFPQFISDPLDPDAVRLGINRGYGQDLADLDNIGLCGVYQFSNIEQGNETYESYESVLYTDGTTSLPLPTTTLSSSQQSDDNSTSRQCDQSSSDAGLVAWIVFGQIIVGIGSAPMFPLIMSYIDDSVSRVKYTLYTACIFMAFAIGPPVGLLMGAWATAFYVDFNRIPSDKIPDLPQEDPRWIGAWWLGLVVCFVGLVVIGAPMFLYPRSMKDKERESDDEKEQKEAEERAERRRSRQRSRGNSIFERTTQVKGMFQSLKRLIVNMPLTWFCIGASAELASIGMFGSFGIKYIETQFGLSASEASSIFGGVLVPVSIFSNIASGYICRRYKLNVKKCAWFLMVLVCLTLPFIPIVMGIGCSNSDVAGVNTEYSDTSSRNIPGDFEDGLRSSCNADCRCVDEIFQPVCGADGVTYISPCHGGCKATMNSTVYTDCTCIISMEGNYTATSGQCTLDCPTSSLIVFILVVFIILFLMASIQNPGAYIIMRIVRDRDRSMAVGWKILVTKCFGYFPSPVYFGAIINSTCTLWQYTCGERGSCWLYDIVAYRYAFFGTLLGLRCFSIVCYAIMIWFMKDDYPDDQGDGKKSSEVVQDNDEIKLKHFRKKDVDENPT